MKVALDQSSFGASSHNKVLSECQGMSVNFNKTVVLVQAFILIDSRSNETEFRDNKDVTHKMHIYHTVLREYSLVPDQLLPFKCRRTKLNEVQVWCSSLNVFSFHRYRGS